MAIGAEHHAAGEGVVLEHDLMDDSGTWCPEAGAVLGTDLFEEVVDLTVGVGRDHEVGLAVDASLDQVIAVGRSRHRCAVEASSHELQPCHLGGGILHGHPVGAKVGVGNAPLEASSARIVEVIDQNLLGQGKGSSELLTTPRKTFVECAVHLVDEFDWGFGKDGHNKYLSMW